MYIWQTNPTGITKLHDLNRSDQNIIDEIRSGNDEPLKALYRLYRKEFIAWAGNRYGANDEQAKDVFQDTVVAFYRNIHRGKLTTLTSTLKSYLFEIGKHKLINLLKRERRITYNDDSHLINRKENEDYMNEENEVHSQKQIREAIAKLPEDCQSVLKLFYFKEYDMDSIAREMGYKNADTAKSKKSVCMKKLLAELKELTMLLML